ncbi:MAG: RagB/SusD family nutrient uptake outer membrane protein [Coprobacter sp.]|nr:RagB/SusD family nutrient uptake outer membrane protein [Coprobacter sp.]
MKNIFYTFILACGLIGVSTSCNDWLTLYPEDKIIEDEYWNSAEDVEMMVASTYRFLLETSVLQQFVYFGELRSDNLSSGNPNGNERAVLDEGNLLSTNSMCNWAPWYKVINICNNVIEKAPGVQQADQNYTVADLQHHLSEVYFVRSLCYFYLIRAYGDVVPYVTMASASDSTNYNVGPTPEREIIDNLVALLKTAKEYATPSYGYQSKNCGRVTKNAVRALLADIYLWDGRYTECIAECNEILNNPIILTGSDLTEWQLLPRSTFFRNVFYSGNSQESIFELNLNADNGNNRSAFTSLYGNETTNPRLKPTTNVMTIYDDADARGMQYIDLKQSKIFKYVGQIAPLAETRVEAEASTYTYRSTSTANNWIIYRLADVYLMKAEALAISGQTAEDFSEAVMLCNKTYIRAHAEGVDSLDHSTYTDNKSVEDLVMLERRREFAFEGKRWFDLLRQVRREGAPTEAIVNTLVNNKYNGTLPDGITGKLSSMGYWYWPIYKDQIDVNPQLKQNEYYQKQDSQN